MHHIVRCKVKPTDCVHNNYDQDKAIVGRKNPGSPDLSHALEEYKRTGDPQGLVDALRDEAQVKRLEAGIDEAQIKQLKAGIEALEVKDLAVNVLRKAVTSQEISPNMLLRIISSLNKSSEAVLKNL